MDSPGSRGAAPVCLGRDSATSGEGTQVNGASATEDRADPAVGPRSPAPVERLSRGWRTLVALVRRVPRAGRVCFLIAFLNAAIWGLIIPPFQVGDEPEHFAYVQYLAETGKPPPQGTAAVFSPQEQTALNGLFFFDIIGHKDLRGILTTGEDRALRSALAAHLSPVGGGGVTNVTNQPPLYYALEAIPYWLSPSHDILTRLVLMRLLSALIAAGTVLAVFMFLRELLPNIEWSWTVGALAVAFQPVFGFIAGGVHGDNLLFFTSALTLWLLVRTHRRGLTYRRAAVIGAVTAAGLLTKLTFVALVPGIALAVLLFAWRATPGCRRRAFEMLAIAGGVALLPVVLYAVLNVAVWHRSGGLSAGAVGAVSGKLQGGGGVTLRETLEYIWQFYLPRLPFMQHNFFPNQTPVLSVYVDGSIGAFGWLDYGFPHWVYTVGRALTGIFVALSFVGLFRMRARLAPLLPLFGCFALMLVGLVVAVGVAGVRYKVSTGYVFEQARYLFPLLALYGFIIVLVALSAGRRWAPAFGGAIIVLAMAQSLFAMTLTISRYYG
ncbi:MAG TPA: DUF2142 domain-containing protein [Solirubrobacteraceae bacterium]|nr:DUF2142 domain-containing protein [Solirubrobacteraceae bacterium]